MYNFTSKAIGGIISVTRQKKSVALWDIIKHEKDLYMSFMKDAVSIGEQGGELNSLHHEFNYTAARE